MKSLLPILVLTVVAAILGSLLATTAHYTTPKIEENRIRAEETELKELWVLLNARIVELDLSQRQLESCSYQIELAKVTTRGYGGDMTIAMAYLGSSLVGVRVISHRETPGFAEALNPSDWISTFGERPTAAIDVVSRATITTRTVLDTVRRREAQQIDLIEACLSDT
ncbi:MAG: FMN-binding protein [Gammaproteobacteria bacterium]|nr:FMN-binding protein [Gammaproteobacteria bacterium]